MESASESATRDGYKFLDDLYDMTAKNGGTPLQFRIFDVQLCGATTADWLRGTICDEGITPEEAEWMIAEGLLRCRTNSRGESGYILYAARQAEVLKKLLQDGKYGTDELRHIMSDWDDYLEAVVMEEPAYDDESIPDYRHIIRRAHEMLALFEEDELLDRPSFIPLAQWEAQKADSQRKATAWRRICGIVDQKAESDLSPRLRDALHRELFRLRWWDEFVRLNMAKQFETAIIQGYSTDATFDGFSSAGGEVTPEGINWYSTLRRYGQTRSEGKNFPLRTPDFNVTQNGLEFRTPPTPERYTEFYESYRLSSLTAALAEIGPELWSLPKLAIGDAACPECGSRFQRTSRKIYCTDKCQKRAKSRRWRERDPERARQCQARYWKGYDAMSPID
jgi:hypothetical protein